MLQFEMCAVASVWMIQRFGICTYVINIMDDMQEVHILAAYSASSPPCVMGKADM